MGWIYLESLLALFILVGIVWWTMRPAVKPPRHDGARAADAEPPAPEGPPRKAP